MEKPQSRRACVFCRSQKIKCSRSLPTCRHCQKTSRTCVYLGQRSLQILDQTDHAASRAIKLWRSRTQTRLLRHDADTLHPHRDLSVPVEDHARRRFMYDFAGLAFTLMLHDILPVGDLTSACSGTQSCLDLAFDAVALTNFSRRHNDQRIVDSAARKHCLAVSRLKESLGTPGNSAPDSTAAAVLLGLYQVFNQDPHLAGSWVHHFRGAMKLLSFLEPNAPHRIHILRLIVKQAVHTSSRMCVSIRLPNELQVWLESEGSLDSEATRLLYRTAQLSSCNKNKSFRLWKTYGESVDEALALKQDFEYLEMELSRKIPSQLRRDDSMAHAKWWRSFSSHPGHPPVEYIYPSPHDAGVWINYRMGRLTLATYALRFSLEFIFDMTQAALLEHAVQLINDICGSLYYMMVQTGDDHLPVDSVEVVPSSVGYQLNLAFSSIRDLLSGSERHCNLLLERAGQDKLAWIDRVLAMFSGTLGIAEALLWQEGDEIEKQAVLNRLVYEE